jgi:hypothetical protein
MAWGLAHANAAIGAGDMDEFKSKGTLPLFTCDDPSAMTE